MMAFSLLPEFRVCDSFKVSKVGTVVGGTVYRCLAVAYCCVSLLVFTASVASVRQGCHSCGLETAARPGRLR